MASGDREKPQCRVCKTVFTFKGPEPLLLPCLHPACKPCVDSGEENITCTTCQQLFSTAHDVFPKHFILSKDLFKLTLKQKPSDILCTFRHDGARADRWCPKCEAFLCITCLEFHKDIKSTRSHVVESLQNYLDPVNDGTNSYGFCTTHQDYPLEFFDSSCGCLVCYKCLKHDHSTCKVEDIPEAFDKMKDSELDNNIEQIASRLDDVTELKQEALAMAKKLDESYKRVQGEVISTFSDIRATLDMREKIVLQETSESFEEVQNVNTERIEVLKQEKTRCEAAFRFMKRSKEISDPVKALTMKKMIDERTKVCTEANLMEIDGRESSICLSTQDLQDIKQTIETFAGLYSVLDENTPVNPEQSHNQERIELKFPGVSGIRYSCDFYSGSKRIRNMPWKLRARFTVQDCGIVFGLYLLSDYEEIFVEWKCEAIVTFEETSTSFGQTRRDEFCHTFTERCPSMIHIYEHRNPMFGFIQDDCIGVSAKVNILNTTRVIRCEDELVTNIDTDTWDMMLYSSYSEFDSVDESNSDDGEEGFYFQSSPHEKNPLLYGEEDFE